MKLQCQIEVVNRTHASLNIKSSGRVSKSTLVIGYEPKNTTEHFILHFSSTNKTGVRYKVKNMIQVFVRFLNEGKVTIRFEEPPHDLCIKSEPVQLKCFLKLLQSCLKGDLNENQLTDLSNISVTAKNNAPTKLLINDRGSYPKTGLPRTLECLYINSIKLFRFPNEILRLQLLTLLDLSDNEIEQLPEELGNMGLQELYLSKNKLGLHENNSWTWLTGTQINKSLKLLDMTDNGLKILPKRIWKLQQLVTLKLGNNLLKQLPGSIGKLKNLRFLNIAKNNIGSLPGSLLQCKLQQIEVTNVTSWFGHFKEDIMDIIRNSNDSTWNNSVGSLINICARTIIIHKVPYNMLPKMLVNYLDDMDICVCGRPAINDCCVTRTFDIKSYFPIVVTDGISHTHKFRFDCHFCSKKCFQSTRREY